MTSPGKYLGVASDSPALDAPTANSLTVTTLTSASIVGNVTGNLVGNVTGNLVGNVTGNLVGNVTGNLVGNVTGVVTNTSYENAISAAGTTQGTGTVLTKQMNTVSTVGVGSGVNLPASVAGLTVTIQNNGANTLKVYPARGASDTINGVAATIGVNVLSGAAAVFSCTAAGTWTGQSMGGTTAVYNVNSATYTITLAASDITGAAGNVDLAMTGAMLGDANLQLPIVADLLAAIPMARVGASYLLRITNLSPNAQIWTIVAPGWTLSGTMTIEQKEWREFLVTLDTLSAATLQSVASGTNV